MLITCIHLGVSYVNYMQVEENMRQAQKIGALQSGQFYFCKNLFPEQPTSPAPSAHYSECELMDANTIFNGKVRSQCIHTLKMQEKMSVTSFCKRN